ncbi:MAG TPA: hypothetical protein VF996_01635 [Candidatus Saccharimonadales bacterium]|jgi:hypothetical protein
MGTRKSDEQHVRTITQNSTGTYAISLPIAQMRILGWRKGQKVTARLQGRKLVVEDWKPK